MATRKAAVVRRRSPSCWFSEAAEMAPPPPTSTALASACLDSGWATGLADAYAVLAFYDYLSPDEGYPKAKRAARRALELDNALAEAHASLGYITLYYDWDAQSAEREFRQAIELNPSYSIAHQWYANLLVATGRFEEAEREMSLARDVNPLSQIATRRPCGTWASPSSWTRTGISATCGEARPWRSSAARPRPSSL